VRARQLNLTTLPCGDLVRLVLGWFACVWLAGCTTVTRDDGDAASAAPQPNVLIIVADDLGYSDIGPFGGEIATPNLDKLAANGLRLTQMHSAPSCSPTRAMMLSGADNHVAGLGAMAEHIPAHYRGQPGFEGVLSPRVASLAERFADAGYRTAMSGKWHLGMADDQRPAQRGFQTSFALLQGAANHFGEGGFGSSKAGLAGATYVENDKEWQPGPGFYSSDVFAAKLIGQLASGDSAAPFFAYLSFTAPHSPLQAHADDIARYADRYRAGWGALARDRLAGQRKAGVIAGDAPGSAAAIARLEQQWDALSPGQQAIEARRMAIYAAMVDRMDHNIGHVFDALEAAGQLDNTVILFLSDNGPAGEDPRAYAVMPGFTERYERADNSLSAMGSAASFVLQDPRWASAVATPSRLFKAFVTQGGTQVPAILVAPEVAGGDVNGTVSDVRDIAPTLLALAGIAQSGTVGGISVAPIEGQDLMPWLAGESAERPARHVAFGFNGQGMVRAGHWKAIRILPPMGDGAWHLYDVSRDPGERTDLKAAEPQRFDAMMESWRAYVARHNLNESADLAPRQNHRAAQERTAQEKE